MTPSSISTFIVSMMVKTPPFLKGRADIRQIQKLLGHRRLSSTEVYTRVELTELHEVIARCHPREKQR
jgi:site-specific recombinase XerD